MAALALALHSIFCTWIFRTNFSAAITTRITTSRRRRRGKLPKRMRKRKRPHLRMRRRWRLWNRWFLWKNVLIEFSGNDFRLKVFHFIGELRKLNVLAKKVQFSLSFAANEFNSNHFHGGKLGKFANTR